MHDSSDGFRLIIGRKFTVAFPGCSLFICLCIKPDQWGCCFLRKYPICQRRSTFLDLYMSLDMLKSLIDLNLIDARGFIPSCRYCLIGIAFPALVSLVDFCFSLGILVRKLHDFPMDTAIITTPWKLFFPSTIEILWSTLSATHWTKSDFLGSLISLLQLHLTNHHLI